MSRFQSRPLVAPRSLLGEPVYVASSRAGAWLMALVIGVGVLGVGVVFLVLHERSHTAQVDEQGLVRRQPRPAATLFTDPALPPIPDPSPTSSSLETSPPLKTIGDQAAQQGETTSRRPTANSQPRRTEPSRPSRTRGWHLPGIGITLLLVFGTGWGWLIISAPRTVWAVVHEGDSRFDGELHESLRKLTSARRRDIAFLLTTNRNGAGRRGPIKARTATQLLSPSCVPQSYESLEAALLAIRASHRGRHKIVRAGGSHN
jgi:hypothetical protein